MIVAVSDAAGQLLWVEGDLEPAGASREHALPSRRRLERGERRHQRTRDGARAGRAGTAARARTPRPAGHAVELRGGSRSTTSTRAPCSVCSTSPANNDAAAPQTLALVRATVAAVEAELRIARLTPHRPEVIAVDWARPRLSALGSRVAHLRFGDQAATFTPRHSEILVLLAESADGMTAAELAVGLSETEQADVTIRAELSRLRNLSGPVETGVETVPVGRRASAPTSGTSATTLPRRGSDAPSRTTEARCCRTPRHPAWSSCARTCTRRCDRGCSSVTMPTRCSRSPTRRTVTTTTRSGAAALDALPANSPRRGAGDRSRRATRPDVRLSCNAGVTPVQRSCNVVSTPAQL